MSTFERLVLRALYALMVNLRPPGGEEIMTDIEPWIEPIKSGKNATKSRRSAR